MTDDKAKPKPKDEAPTELDAREAELARQAAMAEAVREAGLSEADGGSIPQSVSFREPGLGK